MFLLLTFSFCDKETSFKYYKNFSHFIKQLAMPIAVRFARKYDMPKTIQIA